MTKQGLQHHYLSFRVGHQWYGVKLQEVIEVLHFVALTELPSTSPDVLGLLTLRDQVIRVIDLRQRFGLADAPLKLDTPIIALHNGDISIGIVVDDVDDVEIIPELADYEGDESPYIQAVANLATKLLLVLDIAALNVVTGRVQPNNINTSV